VETSLASSCHACGQDLTVPAIAGDPERTIFSRQRD
jgi:hypothetical protein